MQTLERVARRHQRLDQLLCPLPVAGVGAHHKLSARLGAAGGDLAAAAATNSRSACATAAALGRCAGTQGNQSTTMLLARAMKWCARYESGEDNIDSHGSSMLPQICS